ncbi:AraC family transcriptional regulator [Paucibacter sp. APW11]|uniref:AraC family transcriptional regulator n=1 Tax=Roseateles aquae TaxID=3077235 RepID=A0ABU3PGH6_9BURK|nr:AraC family transcriptional regulator [Paucibacter sp. APW11]MDT9001695.1 AraC family transcriptional regulator [Paucibacter sp. APW11]
MPAVQPRRHSSHQHRLHAVLRHIDEHLAEPLNLVPLAGLACLSPFHFHRLFAAWTGETLGDYVQRRRIELAAVRLAAQPRLAVLEAALAVGFGSGEAFSRAFRRHLGCSPSQWRRQGGRQNSNPDQVNRNGDQARHASAANNGHSFAEFDAMPVQLITRPPTPIAYLRYEGPYGPPLQRFWLQQVQPWLRRLGLQQQPQFGLSHDDPQISDPERCRYDACVALPPGFAGPSDLLLSELPGGRYACLPFHGTASQIGAAWTALLRDWMPLSGWQLDARPCFEYYPAESSSGSSDTSGAFGCDICVPVAAL